jgi:hypothetical protein
MVAASLPMEAWSRRIINESKQGLLVAAVAAVRVIAVCCFQHLKTLVVY